MQIFTFFDTGSRGEPQRRKSASSPAIASHRCVIPATAGPQQTCHRTLLPAGERMPASASALAHAQWWACLHGGVIVVHGDEEVAVLASGDVFVPHSGDTLALQAVIDSVLVVVAAPLPRIGWHAEGHTGVDATVGEFIAIDPGEADWAQRLQSRGLLWGVCHHGTLGLQWRDARGASELHTTYLHPGMAFAPTADDDYCIDAMMPGAGLLCCVRPPRAVLTLNSTMRTAQDPPAGWHEAA